MEERNRAEVRLTWGGQEYACRPDMRTLMMIEEQVLLHKLASKIIRGADEIPSSHLVWVIYCLLFQAGARVTADEVYQATFDGALGADTMLDVASWIVAEVYGVTPKHREEDDEDAEKKS